jgi:cytochrome c oxidase subunit 2
MMGVAGGVAVAVALLFGGLYLWPDEEAAPVASGGKAVAFDQALADQGKSVATSNGCLSCHTVDGSKSVGPSWQGTWGTPVDLGGEQATVDEAFVTAAILDPNAQVRSGFGPSMPSYEGKLSDEDVKAVVEYMKSLSGGG